MLAAKTDTTATLEIDLGARFNIDAVAMQGPVGDQCRGDGGAVAGEDANTDQRGLAIKGELADVAAFERDGQRPGRHHSARGERLVNQTGAADRNDPEALGQEDPILREASSRLEVEPKHQLGIPGNHLFEVGVDPNTVDQVRIARYPRCVAFALKRDRAEDHQAYEQAHGEQQERRSSACRRIAFDANVDGHAHTLDEQTYRGMLAAAGSGD